MLEQRIERIAQGLILQGETEGLRKGVEQGLRQGVEQGLREGQEGLFLKLYAFKFQTVPSEVKERASTASREELEVWAQRLLTSESPDEIFQP